MALHAQILARRGKRRNLEVSLVRPPEDEDSSITFWMRRAAELRSLRTGFDNHWREVGELIYPEADKWFRSEFTPGIQRRRRMFSSEGSRALSKFAAAKSSLLIPRSKTWHHLSSDNAELNKLPEVQAFFADLNRLLFDRRQSPRANFFGVTHEGFLSDGAFGNDCLFIDAPANGGVRFKSYHIAGLLIGENHWGQVDTIINEYELSAKAAWQQWGHTWGDGVPPAIARALEGDPYELMPFMHIVAPRRNVDPERLGPDRMPWMSLQISIADRTVVSRGGYFAMPYVYSRELVITGEVYGRSPAMQVLPELQTIEQMKRTHLQVGERLAAPPIMLPDEGFGGGARSVSLLANALNYGALDDRGNALMQPFQTGGRLDITLEMQREEARAIQDAFGVNLFQLLLEEPKSGTTATEILQRDQDRGDLLAPGVNRAQAEKFGPMIEREVSILESQGEMPPIPPVMQEARAGYRVEYVNPAARLQRAGSLAAIEETLQTLTPLMAQDPTAADVFIPEKVARLSMEIRGGDPDVLRTPEEMEQRAQARQQEAQQAQELAATGQAASAAKDMGAAAAGAAGAGV